MAEMQQGEFSGVFADRREAGRCLAAALTDYRGRDVVVLALPRGGVPVADEIARALDAPLELVFVRKIGVPGQPELAAAAVVDGGRPEVVRNEEVIRLAGVSEDYLERQRDEKLAEIELRRTRYLGDRRSVDLKGRTAILVDDGLATGASARAALHAVRRAGARRVVLALPVAPPESLERLRGEADEIVCLFTPNLFQAIGQFYRDFTQLSDDEVIALLAQPGDGGTGDRSRE